MEKKTTTEYHKTTKDLKLILIPFNYFDIKNLLSFILSLFISMTITGTQSWEEEKG